MSSPLRSTLVQWRWPLLVGIIWFSSITLSLGDNLAVSGSGASESAAAEWTLVRLLEAYHAALSLNLPHPSRVSRVEQFGRSRSDERDEGGRFQA